MSKTIQITVALDVVKQGVIGETSITANVERGADPLKNAGKAFYEQASESYHEKKIERCIRGAVSKFAAEMAAFADGTISTTINTNIVIQVPVSDRYNSGLANPLAGLAQDYITNMAIYAWWLGANKEYAQGFAALAQDAIAYVPKCFAKAAPEASASAYSDVTGEVTDEPVMQQVATPVITLAMLAHQAIVTCATAGATMYYTTDGSTPTSESTQVSGAISLGTSGTLKVIAVKEGMLASEIATKNYQFEDINSGGSTPVDPGSVVVNPGETTEQTTNPNP